MKIRNVKSYASIFLLSAAISLTGNTNSKRNNTARCATVSTVNNHSDSSIKAEKKKEKKITKKEKKYSIKDLYLVNTKLINHSIKKGYYIVKESSLHLGSNKCKLITNKKEDYTKCCYQAKTKAKSLCFFEKYKSIGQKDTATFLFEKHYPMSFPIDKKHNTYFSINANINNKYTYQKRYTLEPGSIDLNPTNLKKAQQFEDSISRLDDILKKEYKQNYYTESEIKKLDANITKNKQKVLK